jgi:flagellum-specific peptidoglycan hydrolase FlgJ
MTSSSSFIVKENREAEMARLSIIVHRFKLIDDINKEYDAFYNNLFVNYDNKSKRRHRKNVEFIDKISCHALDSEALPSIAIAQAILETGYGRHNKLKNNIFGIKGKGIKSKTKEFYNGKFVKIKSEFQYFNTLDQAFDRHYNIIGKYGYQSRDYKEWAHRIKDCGYATDPNYAEKLIYIIEKHDLSRLDRIQELNGSLDSLNNIKYVGVSKI